MVETPVQKNIQLWLIVYNIFDLVQDNSLRTLFSQMNGLSPKSRKIKEKNRYKIIAMNEIAILT